ncbi:MAG: S1C family serine protease [Pseudomonadota bacterium]
MKKRFAAIYILLSILCLDYSPSAGNDLMDSSGLSGMINHFKPAVVTVIVYEYTGQVRQFGSGFFYSADGDFITNNHVLTINRRASVKTFDGETLPVQSVIERNEQYDFVKAKTGPSKGEFPFLPIATKLPRTGDPILVIGSPMGLEQTVSEGIVSAWRNIPDHGRVIQITAPISRGSSGGPVLNMNGEVIGVAAFQTKEGQNLNFAIPVTTIFGKTKPEDRQLKIQKDACGSIVISD